MTETPLLTICITTYNSEKTIKKTLESVLAQTYPNIEILVSDNGSSDRTLNIVKSYTDPRIVIRHNIKKIKSDKPYIGSYDNYNGCIESGLIRGEFVAFWHADDLYQKGMAKEEVALLTDNPAAGAVFTLGTMINNDDKRVGKHSIPHELKNKNTYQFKELFKALLRNGNTFLITPTFMTRPRIFKELGLFVSEGEFGTSADLEMWLRIVKKYPLAILQKDLIQRRVGGYGASYNLLRTTPADYFLVIDYYLTQERLTSSIEKKYMRQYEYQKDFDNTLRAMNFLIKGQELEAKKIINASFSYENFQAFFENMTVLRTKVMTLKMILFIGINMKLGKQLGKILPKFV